MDEPVKTRRPYRSAVREQRAHANRRAVLTAARRRFLVDGYARTTVAAVAAEAEVSEDLVYLLFTNKRGLLTATLESAISGDEADTPLLDQATPRAVRLERDQHRQIAMFAHDHTRRIERARPLDDVMRSAAAVDPEIAAQYRATHASLIRHLQVFVTAVAANGPLREGLNTPEAAATIAALIAPDTHRILVEELALDTDAYREWLTRTLTTLLLP